MNLRYFVLLLTCAILPLRGEEQQPLSPALLGALRKSYLPPAAESVTIPLKSSFAGFTVEVQIDGKPVQLLLDTGACCTALSVEIARKLGLKATEGNEEAGGAAGDKVAIRRALTKRIGLGDAWTENEPVVIVEMPEGIDGVLGVSTLADWDLRIDPAAWKLTLFPVGKVPALGGETTLQLICGLANPAPNKDKVQAFRMLCLLVPIRVGDHVVPVLPDTGCSGNLVLLRVLLEKISPEVMKDAGPARFLGSTISGKAVARTGKLPEFTFGPDTLRDFSTEVIDAPHGSPLEGQGIIGLNLLRHYIMTFRFAAGKLHLKPLGTVEEAAQASTTGMSFEQDYKLVDVLPEGPAAKAGLRDGDEILEFDGHRLQTMKFEDFAAVKRLPPGSVLKVRYRRGESNPEETKLTLE